MALSKYYSFTILAVAALNITLFLSGLVGHTNQQADASYSYVDNDYPSTLLTPMDKVELEFYPSVRYTVNDTFADKLWDSTNSESGGFIRLGPDMRVFSIAMFHQLHCISRLQQGLNNNDGSGSQYHHIQHCLNYLRQLFLCSADDTLEPGDTLGTTMKDGKGDTTFTRECRDWSAVYDFSDRNLIEFRQFRAANQHLAASTCVHAIQEFRGRGDRHREYGPIPVIRVGVFAYSGNPLSRVY